MRTSILILALFAITTAGCHHHGTEAGHEHEDEKTQMTAYSSEFELFAEADPFEVGQTSNVLSHFTHLPTFKAVEKGSITIRLVVDGKETTQTLAEPTRKGIYSFDITPNSAGVGRIIFELSTNNGNFQVEVPEITVYASHNERHEAAKTQEPSLTNTSVFTKEQSWKLDFATGYPAQETFGQVIKTTARVQSSQGDEIIVSAKSNGMVILSSNQFQEGTEVSKGQTLCSISGSDLADNNLAVRYAEAKNNYERAKSDFERATELAQDKIVSEKDLLDRKNLFENARAIFENLNKNYSAGGHVIKSPMNGFIKQLFVKNGTFVEAGQPVFTISQNKTLNLIADVRQKHLPLLGSIKSANIRTLHNNQIYTLEALNGKVLSYGKTGNGENFQIPVTLQIDNKGSFFAGGFVEIYLKAIGNTNALTVPNQALIEEQGIFSVYVQVTPELFEKREVRVGTTDGLKTEILKGINSNDRIVTLGAIYIKLAQATGALDPHSGHVH